MRVIIALFVVFLSLASYSFGQSSIPTPSCLLTTNFSSCTNSNGITPCSFVKCIGGLQCVPHQCNTENNQCSAWCSCTKDSDCLNGATCVPNDFGVKICKSPPQPKSCKYYGRVFADGDSFLDINGCNQCGCVNGNVVCTLKACSCPPNKPPVQCFVAPCQVANCKLGSELCVNDYCGGCNAKCRCETSDDCGPNEQCKAESSGWSFCAPKNKRCFTNDDCKSGEICIFSLTNPMWGKCVPVPPSTACPDIACLTTLCANRPRACLHKCSINQCACSDYCECRADNDCYTDEKCSNGKCVNKN